MRRGDVYWADVPEPIGRRPVVLVTRTSALAFLNRVTVAPITTVVRDVPSEVRVGKQNGLSRVGVVGCDSVTTISASALDSNRVGRLAPEQLRSLDSALTFALGIVS